MISCLKERREKILLQNQSYLSIHEKVETPNVLMDLFASERPRCCYSFGGSSRCEVFN